MTNQQYLISRKMNIVELSDTLGNISEACRKLGVSRQHYYDIKSAIKEDGIDGLIQKARNKPRFANRVSQDIEKRILEYSLHQPVHGQITVSNELKKEGLIVSPGGVRGVLDKAQASNVVVSISVYITLILTTTDRAISRNDYLGFLFLPSRYRLRAATELSQTLPSL